jgi:hypothetical protein
MDGKTAEYYIQKAAGIFTLIKYSELGDADSLIVLFKELAHLIAFGTPDEFVVFSEKAFGLNIPVSNEDILGSRIKAFINEYLNEFELEK